MNKVEIGPFRLHHTSVTHTFLWGHRHTRPHIFFSKRLCLLVFLYGSFFFGVRRFRFIMQKIENRWQKKEVWEEESMKDFAADHRCHRSETHQMIGAAADIEPRWETFGQSLKLWSWTWRSSLFIKISGRVFQSRVSNEILQGSRNGLLCFGFRISAHKSKQPVTFQDLTNIDDGHQMPDVITQINLTIHFQK